MSNPTSVRVYRNLHRGGYSIQAKIDGRGWRVIGHADYIRLTSVSFKVYEHARQRVIAKKQKDVHAFVIGTLDNAESMVYDTDRMIDVQKISYNPYKAGYFYRCQDGWRVDRAGTVYLTPWGVYGR